MTAIEQVKVIARPFPLPESLNLEAWFSEQPSHYRWLLAHTFSGVVWGRRSGDGWNFSSGLIQNSPSLSAGTLLQLRLFGEEGELFAWRTDGALHAREVMEGEGDTHDYLDEPYIVWGSKGEPVGDGFTRLEDGDEGLVHAVPLSLGTFDTRSYRPVRLHVRHYLNRDPETGLARVGFSRLRDLAADKEIENGSQA